MHERVLERLELRSDLQKAIEEDQLAVHYQPIVRLKLGEIYGVEALLRWQHPTRGAIQPDQFIPLAEETGLIIPIGRWVLQMACRDGAVMHERFPRDEPLTISVNLSVRQLQSETIVADVQEALDLSGLPPSSLVLEITESVMLADTELAVRRLQDLKSLGVRLAMDDFGTGYSSLSYLGQFPVEILKMDRSFLASRDNDALAAAIIALGENLTLEVVAEGIEHSDQATWLQDQGCELGQGFHFARPMADLALYEYLLSATASDRRSWSSLNPMQHSYEALDRPGGLSRAHLLRRCATVTSACCGQAWRCRCSATGSSSSPSRGRRTPLERPCRARARRHRDDRAHGRVPPARGRRQRPPRSPARDADRRRCAGARSRHPRRPGAHASLRFWELVALVGLYGAGSAFFIPAFDAIVPDLLPPDDLAAANSLDQFVRPIALRLGGTGDRRLAGGEGTGVAFAVNAASFGASAIAVLLMRPPARPWRETPEPALRAVKQGLRFVRRRVWLWGTLLSAALSYLVFLGPAEVLLPFVVKNDLHASAGMLGLVFAAGGLGAVGAAIVMAQRREPRHNVTFMYVAWTLATLAVAGYGLAPRHGS